MKRSSSIVLLCVVPLFVHAASQEVFLLPTKPGRPSEVVHPSSLGKGKGVDYVIQYDGNESNYYLSGLLPGDTIGVFFIPPAACSLVQIHYCKYASAAPPTNTYYAFVADVPDGVTLDDFEEYHSASSMPGPTPVGTMFEGPSPFTHDLIGDWEWDTLDVPSVPDVGTNPFYAATTIEGTPGVESEQSTRIDTEVSPPYYGIAWKQGGAGPEANGPGWYSSWHLFWVRALVRVYENLGAEIVGYDRLPDTYLTTTRTVTAQARDLLGIPGSLHGVAWVRLTYSINGGSETTLDMTRISGDSLDGVYSLSLPAVGVYDTVSYYIATEDLQGVGTTTATASYVVRQGTPGNILLLVEDDPYYISHDPVRSVAGKVDFWDEDEYGRADSSVLNFYLPGKGPGQSIIFWFTWSGFHFVDETYTGGGTGFLEDFLDGGGKLFVSSEDLPCGGFALNPDFEDWVAPAGHFLHDYMKAFAGYDDHETDSVFTQYGVPGDPLTGSANLAEVYVWPYDWAGSGNTWAGRFDDLDPGAVPIFYGAVGEVMGYRYADPGGYKVVFLYYPWHYVMLSDLSGYDTEAQDTLIHNTLTWFGYVGVYEEEAEEAGFRCALHAALPNPVTDVARIGYSLSSPRNVSLKVYDITGRLVKTLVDE
ncbi:hypothetical protein AMJ40_06180, partial [candidate division TA06 bacterium DG_26]